MMVSLLLPIPFFLCFLLAFNRFGMGHPKGFALFISAEAGLEMIYLIFMVYLYHRFSSGVSSLSQPVPILLRCSLVLPTNVVTYVCTLITLDTQYYVHGTHIDVVTSSGLDFHVGGNSSAGRKFEDIWRVPQQHCFFDS